MASDDRGMSYHQIKSEIVKLNDKAILNLEELSDVKVEYKFQPSFDIKIGTIVPDKKVNFKLNTFFLIHLHN